MVKNYSAEGHILRGKVVSVLIYARAQLIGNNIFFVFLELKAPLEGIKSVSGMGLMIGLETEKEAATVVSEAMERGVLLLTAKKKVRLLPPLSITFEELEKAVEVIKEVCA